MKQKLESLAVFAVLALALSSPFVIYLARSPVLIVTDVSFGSLYGGDRIRRETAFSSLLLYRRVKTVPVADDAGDDIVQFAVAEASSRPFCALFPLRFAQAARLYREQNPSVKVILLEGRYAEGSNPSEKAVGGNAGDYFIYKTDIDADFYRAGLAAAILDGEKNGKTAVFLESHLQTQGKEAFLRALDDMEKPLQTSFYTSFSQFSGDPGLSCVVLGGIGADYLDKYSGVPVVFFTWMPPSLLPFDAVLVLNDSPWAQTVQAVRMAAAGMQSGQLRSKKLFLPGKDIDKRTLRKLRKIG